jgi:4-amino-4-deoxy-L-arabinose transferase-like glycosyltransferase
MRTHFTNAPTPASRVWLAFILAAAALTRFYQLGTPSQWFDEMNVTLAALTPMDFIFQRAVTVDFHPPTFTLITKAAQLFAISDVAERMIPALAGLGGVWAMFHFGRKTCGDQTGLWAAALLASSPSHIFYSREVRPYTLIVLVFILMLPPFLDYVNGTGRRSLLKSCCANAILMGLHFFCYLLVAVEGFILAVWLLFHKERSCIKKTAVFLAATALGSLPSLPFLYARLGHEASFAKGYSDVAWLYGDNSFRVLFDNVPWPLTGMVSIGFLAGLAILYLRNRTLALVLLGFLVIPGLVLTAGRYGSYFNSWHMSFILPIVALCAAQALSAVPVLSHPSLPAAFTAGAAALVLFVIPDRFYDAQSHTGTYKTTAERLQPLLRKGDVWLSSDMFSSLGVNWYLRQMSGIHDFRNPETLPGTGGRTLHLLDFSQSPRSEVPDVSGFASLGPPVSVTDLETARSFQWPIPVPGMEKLELGKGSSTLADPASFFAHAVDVRSLTFLPFGGNAMIPLEVGTPSEFTLGWRNPSSSPGLLAFTLHYRNLGPKDRLTVTLQFDDDAPQTVFESISPDSRPTALITYSRKEPFHTCRMSFGLLQGEDSTSTDLGWMYPLAFKELEASLFPLAPPLPFPDLTNGLGLVEEFGGTPCRWGLGPSTVVRFTAQKNGPMRLKYSLFNPLQDQTIWTYANDSLVNRFGSMPLFSGIMFAENEVVFQAKEGENVLVLRYASFNNMTPETQFAPDDPRPLAVLFRELVVEPY